VETAVAFRAIVEVLPTITEVAEFRLEVDVQ
jgi:hypothetical protein